MPTCSFWNLAEWVQVQRINQSLPFADPIARVIVWHGQDIVLKTTPWRAHSRLQKQLDRISRLSHKHGLYEDEF